MRASLRLLFLLLATISLISPACAFDLFRRPRRDAQKQKLAEKPSATSAKAARPFDVEAVKNIAYRVDANADPLRHALDLYLPKGATDFPVVFFVHGGSWKSGDKCEYVKLGELFAANGIGAAVINYRLSPKVQHPCHIEDVAGAFAWVHGNVGKFGGRNDQIIIVGHSAGGHLAALLATDERFLRKQNLTFSDIHGVVAISGVHSISPLLPMFRKVFGGDKGELRNASPLRHVNGRHPPFLLLYAEHDLPFLGRMAEQMNDKLKKAGGDVQCKEMKNRNHYSIIVELASDGDPTRQQIFDFIAKHSDWKPSANRESAKNLIPR